LGAGLVAPGPDAAEGEGPPTYWPVPDFKPLTVTKDFAIGRWPRPEALPRADGNLEEVAGLPPWADKLLAEGSPTDQATHAWAFYTAKDLYLAFKCFDPKVSSWREGDGIKRNWIEIFLDTQRDGSSYYQLFVVADNTMPWHRSVNKDRVSDWQWTGAARYGVGFGKDHWTLEVLVSLEALQLPARPGGAPLGVNLARFSSTSSVSYHTLTALGRGGLHKPGTYVPAILEAGKGALRECTFSPVLPGDGQVRISLGGAAKAATLNVHLLLDTLGEATKELATRKVAGGAETVPFELPLALAGKSMMLTVKLNDSASGALLDTVRVKQALPASSSVRIDKERYWHSDANGIASARVNLSPRSLRDGRVHWRAFIDRSLVHRARLTKNGVGFHFPLSDLAPGHHFLTFEVVGANGEVLVRENKMFRRLEETDDERPRTRKTLPLSFVSTGGASRAPLPVTFGVPFPRGALRHERHVRVVRADGSEVPSQVEVTQRWSPGGAIRWALITCQAEPGPGGKPEARYAVEFGTEVKREPAASSLRVEDGDDRVTVDTGAIRFEVKKRGFNFIDRAWLGNEQILGGTNGGPLTVDHEGTLYRASLDGHSRVAVEVAGSERVVIRAEGWHTSAAGKRLGKYITRIWAYRGRPYLRVFHTFIITEDSRKVRYRDIAMALPCRVPSATASFWLDGKRCEVPVSPQRRGILLQDDWNHAAVNALGGTVRKLASEGTHADGLFRGGRVAVMVKEPWQNYPKEMEVGANGMVVHFWPGHNEGPPDGAELATLENLHQLRFCHTGELLDLQAPSWLPEEFPVKMSPEIRNANLPGAVRDANAIGVAKTHEMLIALLPRDADEGDLQALNRAFQGETNAHVPVDWMAASCAATDWPLHPHDAKNFGTFEDLFSAHFDFERRACAHTADYGMWNFGDGHTVFLPAEKRWSLWRVWRGYHHGCARWPWIAYLRTGDPKYLTHGRRSALHLVDVDTCNYTNDEFTAKSYPAGKLLYGLNDYKGYVHWHAGNRFFDYNSMVDFAFYLYHVSGVRRGRDVALGWLDQAGQGGNGIPEGTGRGLSGPIAALTFGLAETFDPRLLRPLQLAMRSLIDSQDPKTGEFLPCATTAYASFTRYIQYSGSEEAKVALLRIGEALLRDPARACAENYDYAALLAEVTGDQRYVRAALRKIIRARDNTYRKDGAFFDGIFMNGNSVTTARLGTLAPYVMTHLAAMSGEETEPLEGVKERLVWANPKGWTSKLPPEQRTKFLFFDESDQEFALDLSGVFRVRFPEKHAAKPVRYFLTLPDGETVREGEMPPVVKGGRQLNFPVSHTLRVPKDGQKGVYALEFALGEGADHLVFDYPVKGLTRQAYEDASLVRFIWPSQNDFLFLVPKGCPRIDLNAPLPCLTRAELVSPAGDVMASVESGPEKHLVTLPLACDVPPELAAKIWTLRFRGNFASAKHIGIGFRSPSPVRYFISEGAVSGQ